MSTEAKLPPFNEKGDLPPGIHLASLAEIANRFGVGSDTRTRALTKLNHLLALAERTGKLLRFFIFGSFVSATPSPRDVDIVLIMQSDFKLEEAPREAKHFFRMQMLMPALVQVSSGCGKAWSRKRC